jgi:DNA polymerase-4
MPPVVHLRCVAHLDVDAFFASVEQRDEPRLRGRPVAVGTGVVASCSYEARRWGVRTAMRLSEARRLCPALLVLPGDYRRYEQAGRRIQAICLEAASRVEAAALDDLYLDLSHQASRAESVIAALIEQIRAEVGLSVSAGVGTSKLVARVATLAAKRQKESAINSNPTPVSILNSPFSILNYCSVPPGTEELFLSPWPAEVLPGIGPKAVARLERLNVRRVGEVAAMPAGVLCGLFGRRGRVLRDLARGIDPRPVDPDRPQHSVSRRTSFEPPAAEWDFVRAMLDHLLERATSWLRRHDLATRGLTLTMQYNDYRVVEGRISCVRPTDDEGWLKAEAHDRLGRLYVRRLPLRLLGVTLAPLQPPARQGELFLDEALERRRRLEECKDAVRRRYGFMALLPGTSLVLSAKIEHDRDNFRLRTPCLTR